MKSLTFPTREKERYINIAVNKELWGPQDYCFKTISSEEKSGENKILEI